MEKILVLFLGLIALSQQGPILTMKQRLRMNDECIEETGISKAFVQQVIATATIPTDNELYDKYLHCYYKKQNYQTEDGQILYENVAEFLETLYLKNVVTYAINSCKNLQEGNSHGGKAAFFAKCVIDNLLKVEDSAKEREIYAENTEEEQEQEQEQEIQGEEVQQQLNTQENAENVNNNGNELEGEIMLVEENTNEI